MFCVIVTVAASISLVSALPRMAARDRPRRGFMCLRLSVLAALTAVAQYGKVHTCTYTTMHCVHVGTKVDNIVCAGEGSLLFKTSRHIITSKASKRGPPQTLHAVPSSAILPPLPSGRNL